MPKIVLEEVPQTTSAEQKAWNFTQTEIHTWFAIYGLAFMASVASAALLSVA